MLSSGETFFSVRPVLPVYTVFLFSVCLFCQLAVVPLRACSLLLRGLTSCHSLVRPHTVPCGHIVKSTPPPQSSGSKRLTASPRDLNKSALSSLFFFAFLKKKNHKTNHHSLFTFEFYFSCFHCSKIEHETCHHNLTLDEFEDTQSSA
jgi:hypothetical protein